MRCTLHAFILVIASIPSLFGGSSHHSLAVNPLAAQAQNEDSNLFIARVFKSKHGETMPYRIFIPRDYDSQKKYPLVLWLHGGAGRGTDNLKQISGGNTSGSHLWIRADVQKKYPAFVIAPQCPENEMWATVELAKPTRQLRIVEELLAGIQKEFNINSQQLYVTGQSLGGFGTWALISEHPETFAAAIPVCGGGDESMAPRLIHTAIWAFHGEEDQAVSVERSRKMIAAIKKAGGTPRYTEYEGVGHNSWERAFIEPDLISWVFAQRGSPSAKATASPCADALAQHAVCQTANNRAKDIMEASYLEASPWFKTF